MEGILLAKFVKIIDLYHKFNNLPGTCNSCTCESDMVLFDHQ